MGSGIGDLAKFYINRRETPNAMGRMQKTDRGAGCLV
jgi:hypothetical protein